jgi:Alpha-kinase family
MALHEDFMPPTAVRDSVESDTGTGSELASEHVEHQQLLQQPQDQGQLVHQNLPTQDAFARLEKLKSLKAQGKLSNSDFEERKRAIVDELTGTTSSTPGPSAPLAGGVSDRAKQGVHREYLIHHRDGQKIQSAVGAIAAAKPLQVSRSGRLSQSPSSSSSSSLSSSAVVASKQTPTTQRQLSRVVIPKSPPDFADIPAERAVRYTFDLATGEWRTSPVMVKLEPQPFARGSCRLAYHMQVVGLRRNTKNLGSPTTNCDVARNGTPGTAVPARGPSPPPHIDIVPVSLGMVDSPLAQSIHIDALSTPSKSDARRQTNALDDAKQSSVSPLPPPRPPSFVAKLNIDPYESHDSYFMDVAMQTYAREFANKFNQYDPPKPVDFVKSGILELIDRPGNPVCAVELFISGKYRKHNNNYGFVDSKERNTPQAFSHFTYESSRKTILIVDIQGVGDMYTDPQIHSWDGKGFGKGNLGQRGFKKFLGTHRCNAICRYLRLPSVNARDDMGTVPTERYIAQNRVEAVDVAFTPHNYLGKAKRRKRRNKSRKPTSRSATITAKGKVCCCILQ